MKRLIVNADDLGLTPSVNRGILEAHREGIVTSATLMAKGAAFDDALVLAAGAPNLAIGCHIDLIQLAPVLPAEQLKSITADGHFRSGLAKFAVRSTLGTVRSEEIAREATAQMQRLQSAGVRVSHFDTHKHTHVFPRVLDALLRAARECGVRAVRNPFEPSAVVRWGDAWLRGGVLRWAAVRALRGFAPIFRRRVERAGMRTTDGTVGIALTGQLDQQALCELLQRVPPGTWELVVHPGYAEPALAALSRLTTSREAELRMLTSAETRQEIEAAGIELITYVDL